MNEKNFCKKCRFLATEKYFGFYKNIMFKDSDVQINDNTYLCVRNKTVEKKEKFNAIEVYVDKYITVENPMIKNKNNDCNEFCEK